MSSSNKHYKDRHKKEDHHRNRKSRNRDNYHKHKKSRSHRHSSDVSEGEILSDSSYRKYKHKYKLNQSKSHKKKEKPQEGSDSSICLIEDEDPNTILEKRRLERIKILEKYKNQSNDNKIINETYASANNPIESDIIAEPATNGYNTRFEIDTGDMFVEDDEQFLYSEKQMICNSSKQEMSIFTKNTTRTAIDGFDDEDGYYVVQIGELFDNRYQIFGYTGSGVFSNVVRARDLQNNDQEIVIKIIRNNEMMLKQGLKELEIMKKINENDLENKLHCLRLLGNFIHRSHQCLIFEPMSMNLRELIQKYGSGIGLSIKAVRTYSHQLLLALSLLRKIDIIHADIKPDNILVTENRLCVKLSDFGSASNSSTSVITPYLVSRFYRAPEISKRVLIAVLGRLPDFSIDLWSLGCTMFELYTGDVCFPGQTNNDMLRLFMITMGKIPHKFLRKCHYTDKHFDQNYNFLQHEIDRITGKEKLTVVNNIVQKSNIQQMLSKNTSDIKDDAIKKKLFQLGQLLENIFVFIPTKRISIENCLHHSFIQERI